MSFLSESQLKNQRRSAKIFMSLNESSVLKTKIFLSHKQNNKMVPIKDWLNKR